MEKLEIIFWEFAKKESFMKKHMNEKAETSAIAWSGMKANYSKSQSRANPLHKMVHFDCNSILPNTDKPFSPNCGAKCIPICEGLKTQTQSWWYCSFHFSSSSFTT